MEQLTKRENERLEENKKICWSQRGNCHILLFIKNKISEKAAFNRRSNLLGFGVLLKGKCSKNFLALGLELGLEPKTQSQCWNPISSIKSTSAW